jgi:L-fucose mutarotase/ribose pyranase (RbsD/FucU family)
MATSPITLKEARKRTSAAAAYEESPQMERILTWEESGDPRFERLDPATRMSLGFYRRAKAAHCAVTTGEQE